MKTIFIMADTYRRDHVGCYGNKAIHTPNLDRLAARSFVFDHHYAGSFPTLPNRRDLHLGHGSDGGVFNQWRGIKPGERTTAARLADKGVPSMMITDVANTVTNSANLYHGFSSYCVNRGQEGDNRWSDLTVPLTWPVDPQFIRYNAERWHHVLDSESRCKVEDDWFAPGTFKIACDWLERNYKRENFLLWIETFDPHEPWDPPQWYIDLYDPGYQGRTFVAPTYGAWKEIGYTEREVRHIHARYCAECTMVDAAVGRLLGVLEKLRLDEEVAIIFTSDHGTYMNQVGDAGMLCKPAVIDAGGRLFHNGMEMIEPLRFFPLRTGTMRTPFIFHMPGQKKGKRVARVAQPWDVAPTILELFGQKPAPEHIGESLIPVIEGKRVKPRPYAFNGASRKNERCRQAINGNWIYSVWPDGGREPSLIDLRTNPTQDKNFAKQRPEVCRKMQKAIEAFDPVYHSAGD
jgi:arylsulfatase A-like enzyme